MCTLLPLEIFMDSLQLRIAIEMVTILCVEKPAASCQQNETCWQNDSPRVAGAWAAKEQQAEAAGPSHASDGSRVSEPAVPQTAEGERLPSREASSRTHSTPALSHKKGNSDTKSLWVSVEVFRNKHTQKAIKMEGKKNESGELWSEIHMPVGVFSLKLYHDPHHRVARNRYTTEMCFTENQTRFLSFPVVCDAVIGTVPTFQAIFPELLLQCQKQ